MPITGCKQVIKRNKIFESEPHIVAGVIGSVCLEFCTIPVKRETHNASFIASTSLV